MQNDLISVILPVYNSNKTISNTIESVLNQTYRNFELIIVNDGSTDSTKEICKKFTYDSRVKYFEQKNKGVSVARNYALKIIKGKYVTFIDSDDIYNNNFLKEMYDIIKENDLGICCYSILSKNSKIIDNKKYIQTNKYNSVIEQLQPKILFNQVWNKIYCSEIIAKYKICFDETLNLGEDYIFNIEYIQNCKKIYYINKSLYNYRIVESGLSFKKRENLFEIKQSNLKVLEKLYEDKKYNKDYIYMQYIKNYLGHFSSIISNTKENKEKYNKIKEIKNSNEYKETTNKIKRNASVKIRLLRFMLLNNNMPLIYGFSIIANIYDKKIIKRKLKGEK